MTRVKVNKLMAIFLSAFLLVACAGEKEDVLESAPGNQAAEEEMDLQEEIPAESDAILENEVKDENKENENNQSPYSIEMLFPFENDQYRVYEGKGGEYAGFDEYVDFRENNRIQLRMNNGGTEIVRVIERKDGELLEILSEPEVYYVENFLSKKPKEARVLLKEPIVVGTSWVNSEVETSTITSIDTTVQTPLGTFTAVEVVRVSQDDGITYTTTDYYVPEIGLVKTINGGGGYTTEASLKVDEKMVTQRKVMNFYYPNIDDERLFLYRKEIAFKTNDIPRNLFLAAYKDLPEEAGIVLTENTKVNYLYLNNDGMVYIDLSQDFITEMNAGAGYEVLILQSLANTFGDYYGAQKVMLTIEGEPYESGHIVLDKFEPLDVNYKSILNMN